MQIVRAAVFNLLFYTLLIFYMLAILPLLLFSRRTVTKAIMIMLRLMAWLQALFGIKIDIRGLHNIPAGGCLVASKHQSMWETFMLPSLFADPGFIYKQELARIPLYGAYMRKFDMVAIDRSKGAAALREMTARAAEKIAQGRQIIIFPEGTRRPPGSPPSYKTGIALLYETAKAPVVPVALNSGAYWSNYFWHGKRGAIVIDILPPIPPGLPRDEFLERLQSQLENASKALDG